MQSLEASPTTKYFAYCYVVPGLIRIMVTHREYIYIDSTAADRIDQTMFVRNSTTPFPLVVALKWFRFSYTSKGMLLNVLKQLSNAFHDFCITQLLPIVTVFLGFCEQYYFHKSSIDITEKLPFLMSSSPCLIISSNSSFGRIFSFIILCEVIRFKALSAFFIKPSSSAMMLSSRNSSAFSCSDVITSFFSWRQSYNK